MSSWKVEFAKSGRSACKKCKEKIAQGEIRLGEDRPNGDYTMTSWFHPKCFSLPRKFATGSGKITAEEFVESHLEDVSEEGTILPSKADELAEAIGAKASPKKAGKGGGGSVDGNSFIEKLKADFEAMDSAEDDDGKAGGKKRKASGKSKTDKESKKAKTSDDVPASSDVAVTLYGKYHKYKADDLKDILRYNRQVLKGTKDVLLHKVIDGELRGRLSFCGCCDGGKLKFAEDCSKIVCSGTFDENTQQRLSCDVTYSFEDAPRSKLPWLTGPPTKEQEEAMDAEKDAANGGKGGGDDTALTSLMDKAKELNIDMKSKDKIKESTTKMIKLLEGSDQKLDLPDDDKQAFKEVGKLMLANKESSPDGMVKLIVEKFGFIKAKAEKAAKKEAAAEDACKVPENAGLYCAMKELSDLYFKEGNRNAGASYKKVATAIKELGEVVTPENAKSMGKGKGKVANIGPSSADKMFEFVTTGTIEKLEEKRQNAA